MNTKITRLQKAHLVARLNLAKIMQRDAQGRAKHVLVPGSEGKQYNVYLTRNEGVVFAECNLNTGNGEIPCRGNRTTLCVHCLTALLVAADGCKLSFATDKEKAEKVQRLTNGKIGVVVSKQSLKKFYVVWR